MYDESTARISKNIGRKWLEVTAEPLELWYYVGVSSYCEAVLLHISSREECLGEVSVSWEALLRVQDPNTNLFVLQTRHSLREFTLSE